MASTITLRFADSAAQRLDHSYSSRLAAAGSLRQRRQQLEEALRGVAKSGDMGRALAAEVETLSEAIQLLARPRSRPERPSERRERREQARIEREIAAVESEWAELVGHR